MLFFKSDCLGVFNSYLVKTVKKTFIFCIISLVMINAISAKVVFCSSSKGDNTYSGVCPDFPVKEINYAIDKADTIFLLAGDVFYEQVVARNKFISRYGNGKNPIISGFKKPTDKGHWKKVSDNIWVIDLSGRFYSGFDTQGASLLNNVGCVYDWENDLVHGRKVQYYKELKENWDMWQTEHFERETPEDNFSLLYLYLETDPNFLNLSFSVGGIGISLYNSTLSHVNVVGFGFGVSAGANVEISNCHVDIIGGMTQLGKQWFVNYGNGIEFYVSYDISNSCVHDCYISRTYDSGITIQAGTENHIPHNIKVYNNLVENCGQAWEDFLMTPDESVVFDQCEFYNNFVINSGTSGFNYPKGRTQYCHIIGLNNKGNKGMIVRDNTFAGGNYYHSTSYCGKYKSNVWNNNTCYISPGNYLLYDHEGTIIIRLSVNNRANNNSLDYYRLLTGDDTHFHIYKEKRVAKISKRIKKRYLKNHSY